MMQNNHNSGRVNQLTEIIDQSKPKDDSSDRFFAVWGFRTEDLYRIALQFFKDKDGSKAVPISYKDRVHLIALTKQVSFGAFQPQAAVEIGLFDVVGNDRKQAWQSLGDMPKETAMCEFISALSNLCPLFEPYVTAHRVEKEEQERKKKEEEEELNRQKKLQLEEEEKKMEEEKMRQMNQEMMIRLALNQQTNLQFRTYAEQQFPDNRTEQEYLIAQLQEQHFAQYMMQVYNQQSLPNMSVTPAQQLARQTSSTSSSSASSLITPEQQKPYKVSSHVASSLLSQLPGSSSAPNSPELRLPNGSGPHDGNKNLVAVPGPVTSDFLPENKAAIEPASLWTRRDLQQFKQSLKGEAESVITVQSGETITVRIPTHEDGSCLFWEFATEAYDIGFGMSFEWTDAPSNSLTVEVSNSARREDKNEPQWRNTPPTDVIIPVYRRDSHVEVFCGSHVYPGRGMYLFIFDNSYSLWRSKSIYYRVYYTR